MSKFYLFDEDNRPVFVSCGCCDCYHPVNFYGDCRDDNNRFASGELDEKYGSSGWIEYYEM